jgi:hypothetical protein
MIGAYFAGIDNIFDSFKSKYQKEGRCSYRIVGVRIGEKEI